MSLTEDLAHALEGSTGVRLAVMFGSAARGTARSDSDVDVGRSVDLVSLRTAPPLLRFEIARVGQLLIERDPHAWVEFRAHAMIDWWDWAPTARIMHRAVRSRLQREATRGSS